MDQRVFHGTNQDYWDSHSAQEKNAGFWTSDPTEALEEAISNAIKFKSDPIVVVHHEANGDRFKDITTGGPELRRTYESKTVFDENDPKIEIYYVSDLEEFFTKYLSHDLEIARAKLQAYLEKRESAKKLEWKMTVEGSVTPVGIRIMQTNNPTEENIAEWTRTIRYHLKGYQGGSVTPSPEWTREERARLLLNLADRLEATDPGDAAQLNSIAERLVWLIRYPSTDLENHRNELLQ